MIRRVLFRKGNLCIVAVNRARRSVHQPLHAAVTTGLKDGGESDQVGVHVGHGILQRITHSYLRREMNHPLRPGLEKQLGKVIVIGNIQMKKPKPRVRE